MNTSYTDLSDEELISVAIGFVREGTVVPREIEDRLRAIGMYDLIVYPVSLGDLGE